MQTPSARLERDAVGLADGLQHVESPASRLPACGFARVRIDQAAGAGPYVIRSSLYRSESGWTRIAAPVLTVAEGEQASARFAGGDGSDFSLALLVR